MKDIKVLVNVMYSDYSMVNLIRLRKYYIIEFFEFGKKRVSTLIPISAVKEVVKEDKGTSLLLPSWLVYDNAVLGKLSNLKFVYKIKDEI